VPIIEKVSRNPCEYCCDLPDPEEDWDTGTIWQCERSGSKWELQGFWWMRISGKGQIKRHAVSSRYRC
jgi:hypothetical protein